MSYRIWTGPSEINGAPIVALLTQGSENEKTGDMDTVWIAPAHVAPHVATRTGEDESVCGSCPMRPALGGGCYVRTYTPSGGGTRSVWAHQNDLPTRPSARPLRLGGWGDPAALPVDVVEDLVDNAGRWTGYTHRWRERPDLRATCMASVDSPEERAEAKALGWRTFRKRRAEDPILPGEIVCPASDEGGNRRQCVGCLGCDGTHRGAGRVDFVIIDHGPKA